MSILLPILFQVFYFVSLVLVVKKRGIIKKSPYLVIICGVLVLGVLVNLITIYEIYEYFAKGKEIEFFLGGFILNYIAFRMAKKMLKSKLIQIKTQADRRGSLSAVVYHVKCNKKIIAQSRNF